MVTNEESNFFPRPTQATVEFQTPENDYVDLTAHAYFTQNMATRDMILTLGSIEWVKLWAASELGQTRILLA